MHWTNKKKNKQELQTTRPTVEEKTTSAWRRVRHVQSCRNTTPAATEECEGLFLTHLPGDCLPSWRTTPSLLCAMLTIETRARVSERPRIPDLGHNKSPTGSLFLIAATRSSSRPSYKHPLPVLLSSHPDLVTWRLMTSPLQNKPALLRRDGSCWDRGQWRVKSMLCNQWEDLFPVCFQIRTRGYPAWRGSRLQGIIRFLNIEWRTQMTQQTCVYKIDVSADFSCDCVFIFGRNYTWKDLNLGRCY